jgi:hypothetical protein
MSRELEKILNIEPSNVTSIPAKNIITESKQALAEAEATMAKVFESDIDPRFNVDFEDVRNQIKDILGITGDSVKKLGLIAEDHENASLWTALAALTKVLLDANRQLLDIFEMKKRYRIDGNGGGNFSPSIGSVQNAVFVGTPSALKDLIRNEVPPPPRVIEPEPEIEPPTIEGTIN